MQPISGGSALQRSSDVAALRAQVRLWLERGLLPTPGDTWAGPGTGKSCAVCAVAIGGADIEYEVGDGAGRLYAHEACYTLWLQEATVIREQSKHTNSA
jgi:hypothetical protein